MKKYILAITLLFVGNGFANIEKINNCLQSKGLPALTDEQKEGLRDCIGSVIKEKLG